jgi:lipopolysaccharide transport system permease protein
MSRANNFMLPARGEFLNSNQTYSTAPSVIFTSLWQNRLLVMQMIRREVSGRYRGSILGMAWSLINPLLMIAVYTFVFSVVFRARWNTSGDESKTDFAIILFAGMIVFNLFAEIINRAPGLIISNVNFVKKVLFPLEILPWVALGSVLFHSLVSLFVLLMAQLIINHSLAWTVLLFPIVLLPLLLAALGAAWFLAAIGVYVRDVGQITGMFTTILLFISAVFYPLTALPETYRAILSLNPLALIISESRKVLIYGDQPDWISLSVALFTGCMMAVLGFWWFQKTRRGFADVL